MLGGEAGYAIEPDFLGGIVVVRTTRDTSTLGKQN
jgi:hypothetical protein